jgi:hypothetical protein
MSDRLALAHAIEDAGITRGKTQRLALIILVAGLLSALWSANASSATPDAGRFDGKWAVTLVCPKAPDGALPWTNEFVAVVKGAMIHGEHGLTGQPGWLSLDGRIQPDGAANLEARGVTGDTAYNINQTVPHVPYKHDVTAHFDASRGTGNWRAFQSNGQVRICDFTFTRQ